MSDFHQSFMHRSTETEKKGRKIKNRREEVCNCFPPLVKLHYHDCPAVMRRCPIHGNIFRQCEKPEKVEREQNVIISFHPSSKTERLLQPIKSLLAHCNSETKINFQYYSPGNSTSKESLKAQHGHNGYDNLKRTFNNNIFVEKTKSFVTGKSNKVKKLKQCFHSPCNSVVQKTRSQTSVKEKMNQILREEAKQTQHAFYNMVPEVPPNDTKRDPTSRWFYSNLKGLRNCDRPSDEKMDSDFITVTQRDQNNAINHKIFEIKHRKGLNEIPFVGFPKQATQLVYSTVNVGGGQLNQTTGNPWQDQNENPVKEETEETGKDVEVYGSRKSQSDTSESSGSVYITPFLLLPKGMEDSDSDMKLRKTDQAIQVTETPEDSPKKISDPVSTKSVTVQVPSTPSVKSSKGGKSEYKSISIQTQSFSRERISTSRPICVYDYDPQSETAVEELYIGGDRILDKRNEHDSGDPRKEKVDASQSTDGPYREVLITARWDSRMKDQTSQTEDLWKFQVSVKAFESKINKSQNVGPRIADRGMQTSFFDLTPEETEVNSPNVTYVMKKFDEKESDPAIDKLAKIWWGKSHSDSDLCERLKCSSCRGENENPFLQSDASKPSQMNTADEKRTFTKIYESNAVPATSSGPRGGNVTLRTKETIERFPDSKRTSTKEEEFSASVSDLSELKKIIQEFFEKRNLDFKKTCACEKTKITETGNDGETAKDGFIMTPPQSGQKADKLINAQVQTQSLPQLKKKQDMTVDTKEAQTSIGLLLNETEQQKHQTVKLRRTVVVNGEDQTKIYFICAMCGRDIQNSVEATTNTEEVQKKEMSTVVDTERTQVPETKMQSRNNQNLNPSKAVGTSSRQTETRGEEKKTIEKRSQIPIPVFIRFKNERTEIQTECSDVYSSGWQKERIQSVVANLPQARSYRNCDCTPLTAPNQSNTSRISSKSKGTHSQTNQDTRPPQPSPEQGESSTRRDECHAGKSKPRRFDPFYPLIIRPLWPKHFMKTWKSMDSSMHPSDYDPKWQTSKQKRSYEKDLDAANGKKLKVEFAEPLKEHPFGKLPLHGFAKNEKPGDFIIWPNAGLMAYHPTMPDEETSRSSADEGQDEKTPEKPLTRETSPETDDDILGEECVSVYDSNDMEQFSENCFLEEDEPEEDEEAEEDIAQEPGPHQVFSRTPKLKLQSLSAVFDNKSFYSDMATSKSLNQFWLLGEPKKTKRKYKKKTQNERPRSRQQKTGK